MNDMIDGSGEHVGDDAEAYALGLLDPSEARRVDAHVATCIACAERVGAAERAVTALDDATVPMLAPPAALAVRIASIQRVVPLPRRQASFGGSIVRWCALAASLMLIVGGAAGTRSVLHMRAIVAQDDAALAVVANAHFKHATLAKIDPSAPTAKVLWALSRRWVYVIVDSPECACTVAAATDAGSRDLGSPLARGATAVLFANDLPAVRRIELRRGDRTIEAVDLP